MLLLERALVEGLADELGAGAEDLVEHPRVERSGRDRVDVDALLAQLLGEGLGEAHDGRLGGGVGAQPG